MLTQGKWKPIFNLLELAAYLIFNWLTAVRQREPRATRLFISRGGGIG